MHTNDIIQAYSSQPSDHIQAAPARRPFLRRGIGHRDMVHGWYSLPGSEWDAGLLFMSRGMVEPSPLSPTVNMYYFGTQLTHGFVAYADDAEVTNVTKGIGRVAVRREGFVSLSTDYSRARPQASLQTVPLNVSGAQSCSGDVVLQVNLDTTVGGLVQFGLFGIDGQAIPGYTLNESFPIKANAIRATVFWENNPTGNIKPALEAASNVLSIIVLADDADLYSFVINCLP